MDGDGGEKKEVRRPMNAFLIFCKRHRSVVREKHPELDNRSVTRVLGDLWANLGEEKATYTTLAKQYKDAFMKANPDYKWHNTDKSSSAASKVTAKPTNSRVIKNVADLVPEGGITPGKLADPDKMGGLNLLLLAGRETANEDYARHSAPKTSVAPHITVTTSASVSASPATCFAASSGADVPPASTNSALLQLAEMCTSELHSPLPTTTPLTLPHQSATSSSPSPTATAATTYPFSSGTDSSQLAASAKRSPVQTAVMSSSHPLPPPKKRARHWSLSESGQVSTDTASDCGDASSDLAGDAHRDVRCWGSEEPLAAKRGCGALSPLNLSMPKSLALPQGSDPIFGKFATFADYKQTCHARRTSSSATESLPSPSPPYPHDSESPVFLQAEAGDLCKAETKLPLPKKVPESFQRSYLPQLGEDVLHLAKQAPPPPTHLPDRRYWEDPPPLTAEADARLASHVLRASLMWGQERRSVDEEKGVTSVQQSDLVSQTCGDRAGYRQQVGLAGGGGSVDSNLESSRPEFMQWRQRSEGGFGQEEGAAGNTQSAHLRGGVVSRSAEPVSHNKNFEAGDGVQSSLKFKTDVHSFLSERRIASLLSSSPTHPVPPCSDQHSDSWSTLSQEKSEELGPAESDPRSPLSGHPGPAKGKLKKKWAERMLAEAFKEEMARRPSKQVDSSLQHSAGMGKETANSGSELLRLPTSSGDGGGLVSTGLRPASGGGENAGDFKPSGQLLFSGRNPLDLPSFKTVKPETSRLGQSSRRFSFSESAPVAKTDRSPPSGDYYRIGNLSFPPPKKAKLEDGPSSFYKKLQRSASGDIVVSSSVSRDHRGPGNLPVSSAERLNPITACGKRIVDHIVERLFQTDFSGESPGGQGAERYAAKELSKEEKEKRSQWSQYRESADRDSWLKKEAMEEDGWVKRERKYLQAKTENHGKAKEEKEEWANREAKLSFPRLSASSLVEKVVKEVCGPPIKKEDCHCSSGADGKGPASKSHPGGAAPRMTPPASSSASLAATSSLLSLSSFATTAAGLSKQCLLGQVNALEVKPEPPSRESLGSCGVTEERGPAVTKSEDSTHGRNKPVSTGLKTVGQRAGDCEGSGEQKPSLSSESCEPEHAENNNCAVADWEVEAGIQPVRKSRRANRGQKYQALINEGIIQPSRERLAARTAERNGRSFSTRDEFERQEQKRCLKRSASERDMAGDSVSTGVAATTPTTAAAAAAVGQEKKKVADSFDLEKEIKSLPVCSVEQLRKKQQRSNSGLRDNENSSASGSRHGNSANVSTCASSRPTSGGSAACRATSGGASATCGFAGDVCSSGGVSKERVYEAEVPRFPLPKCARPTEPVTGSRKRKVRKHLITRISREEEAKEPAKPPVQKPSASSSSEKESHKNADGGDNASLVSRQSAKATTPATTAVSSAGLWGLSGKAEKSPATLKPKPAVSSSSKSNKDKKSARSVKEKSQCFSESALSLGRDKGSAGESETAAATTKAADTSSADPSAAKSSRIEPPAALSSQSIPQLPTSAQAIAATDFTAPSAKLDSLVATALLQYNSAYLPKVAAAALTEAVTAEMTRDRQCPLSETAPCPGNSVPTPGDATRAAVAPASSSSSSSGVPTSLESSSSLIARSLASTGDNRQPYVPTSLGRASVLSSLLTLSSSVSAYSAFQPPVITNASTTQPQPQFVGGAVSAGLEPLPAATASATQKSGKLSAINSSSPPTSLPALSAFSTPTVVSASPPVTSLSSPLHVGSKLPVAADGAKHARPAAIAASSRTTSSIWSVLKAGSNVGSHLGQAKSFRPAPSAWSGGKKKDVKDDSGGRKHGGAAPAVNKEKDKTVVPKSPLSSSGLDKLHCVAPTAVSKSHNTPPTLHKGQSSQSAVDKARRGEPVVSQAQSRSSTVVHNKPQSAPWSVGKEQVAPPTVLSAPEKVGCVATCAVRKGSDGTLSSAAEQEPCVESGADRVRASNASTKLSLSEQDLHRMAPNVAGKAAEELVGRTNGAALTSDGEVRKNRVSTLKTSILRGSLLGVHTGTPAAHPVQLSSEVCKESFAPCLDLDDSLKDKESLAGVVGVSISGDSNLETVSVQLNSALWETARPLSTTAGPVPPSGQGLPSLSLPGAVPYCISLASCALPISSLNSSSSSSSSVLPCIPITTHAVARPLTSALSSPPTSLSSAVV
ncbi:uncharacterized protein LOC101849267, partial [Aplysia californica]|uniref:Uncharacterized protein LOC101849267 n=1 Tax=Aplysia californica TaxID=6500 RepID=A0ABM1W441_APLCA